MPGKPLRLASPRDRPHERAFDGFGSDSVDEFRDSQDRLVDLYTDGEVTKDAYQQKRDRLAKRKAAL
ncbi:MAG: hypothetical protein OXC71_04810, partial [Chloroflexi bacterium]|nr:hypothetical protein [Chloroflexota bacterium]